LLDLIRLGRAIGILNVDARIAGPGRLEYSMTAAGYSGETEKGSHTLCNSANRMLAGARRILARIFAGTVTMKWYQ
jgi:hypothetical protein